MRIEQILKAAADVFWEVGYEAATTHQIAKHAQTAVGTLYRFFPNKLAIFHALEQEHRQNVERINAWLLTPTNIMSQPLAAWVRQLVETYAEYFEDLIPRVVYVQYWLTPDIFAYFNEDFNQELIRLFATLLRSRNRELSVEKSELLGEVIHRCYTSLLLVALQSDDRHRDLLYLEIQDLLVSYLQPHVGDEIGDDLPVEVPLENPLCQQAVALSGKHSLNHRQQAALIHLLQHGSLTIQSFEAICPERSRRTLQRDLKQLVDKGLLQVEGDTNLLTYRMKPQAN